MTGRINNTAEFLIRSDESSKGDLLHHRNGSVTMTPMNNDFIRTSPKAQSSTHRIGIPSRPKARNKIAPVTATISKKPEMNLQQLSDE